MLESPTALQQRNQANTVSFLLLFTMLQNTYSNYQTMLHVQTPRDTPASKYIAQQKMSRILVMLGHTNSAFGEIPQDNYSEAKPYV
jgi:glycosylphosphatidylinositol transamidase (GPIT) subunit GPI8